MGGGGEWLAENVAAHRIGEEADEVEAGRRGAGAAERGELSCRSEKDTMLAQRLGQLQLFMAVYPLECMGQLASFGPT
jgi:hypothetical protein